MKKYLMYLALVWICTCRLAAQCPDFTDLDGPNVVCRYGNISDPTYYTGIAPDRFTIITQQGLDGHTGEALPLLPDGENIVVRLGNDLPFWESEEVNYHFTVDSTASILLLKFALVLYGNYPNVGIAPRLLIRVRDVNETPIHSCAEYEIRADSVLPGLQFQPFANFRWLPWSTLAIDMSSHIGQEVCLQLRTYDGDGEAYTYYTAQCVSNHLALGGCNNNQISLAAPGGFSNYLWDNGASGQTNVYTISESVITAQCQVQADISCPITFFETLMPQNVPSANTILYDTVCEGDSYHQQNFDLPAQTEGGLHTYSNHFVNTSNCTDGATHYLFLTVKPREYHYYDMACHGESYNNYGFQYNSLNVGTFTDTVVSVSSNGCDSITILHLTVASAFTLPNAISGPTEVCCNTEQVFVLQDAVGLSLIEWNVPVGAEIVSGQGTQEVHVSFSNFATSPAMIGVTGANGCGSGSLPFSVDLQPSYKFFFRDTICTGTAYNDHGFVAGPFDTTGLFTYNYAGVTNSGCDSSAMLQLLVTATPEVDVLAVPEIICLGDSVELHALGPHAHVIIDTLQAPAHIGDILCTDGSIVRPADWPCGQTAKGVVFYADSTGHHGWALALQNSGCVWWTNNGNDVAGLQNFPSTRDAIFDLDGYSNTQIIRSAGGASIFPAAYLLDFENGWYLPAAGQMRYLYSVLLTVNQSLQLVGGTPIDLEAYSGVAAAVYWTSTEGNGVYVLCPWNGVRSEGVSWDHNVRGVCNF